MSVNKYNATTGQLEPLSQNRTWVGTQAEYQAAITAGTIGNDMLIYITDDETEAYANQISYDNTDSGLTADNIQDAIDEVVDEKAENTVVSKTANGLCPQLPDESSTTKYLRQDGTWVVPPDNNTTTGNGITTYTTQSGSGTTVSSSISSGTTMDNAIGTLLNNDAALNSALSVQNITNSITVDTTKIKNGGKNVVKYGKIISFTFTAWIAQTSGTNIKVASGFPKPATGASNFGFYKSFPTGATPSSTSMYSSYIDQNGDLYANIGSTDLSLYISMTYITSD